MYIFPEKNAFGSYPALQSKKAAQLLDFPEEFIPEFYKSGKKAAGFVNIEHNETAVTTCTWNESAYQKWLSQQPDPAEALAMEAREKRDQLLRDCDWTQIPDSPLSESEKESWKTYRQELRDVPQQRGFPEYVDWPEEPK